jgi:hypothetical protein
MKQCLLRPRSSFEQMGYGVVRPRESQSTRATAWASRVSTARCWTPSVVGKPFGHLLGRLGKRGKLGAAIECLRDHGVAATSLKYPQRCRRLSACSLRPWLYPQWWLKVLALCSASTLLTGWQENRCIGSRRSRMTQSSRSWGHSGTASIVSDIAECIDGDL